MEKQFSELNNGDSFTINNVEYVKSEEVRISCCKTINAYVKQDSNQKIFFPGHTTVTING